MRLRTEGGWIRAGLTVLVAGVLGGGVLAAAGGSNPRHKVTADGVAAASPAAAPQAPADVPKGDPKVGEKVVMGSDGGSVTVSAVEDNVSAGRLFGAGKGFKYIAAEVKGCSGPHEKNILFQPSYFLLRLDDGTMHDHGPGAKKPELVGDTVPAGDCLSGWVTFTVPEGALPTGVVYDGSARTTWTVPIPKGAKATTTTTLRPGATTAPIDGSTTTTTTKNKATTTTVTTARTKTTATTAKPATTTTTTAKPAATTTTTGKSASATTTSTTGPAKAATTTTTGPGVAADPTSPGR
ncbi:MAG TPA: hypothetical protein VGR20_07140 [Acidimicrobiia bacterium]|nr:hypothetical protein [Acidimicrobiia bacterium]